VLPTVTFDDQSPIDAYEVDNVWCNWMLPPKLKALKLPASQTLPEFSFSVSLVLA